MPFLHNDGTEIKSLDKERRQALLSGDAKTYHDHMMHNDPEYRDAIIAQEKNALERQLRRYEDITKKYSTLTQLSKDKDTVIE